MAISLSISMAFGATVVEPRHSQRVAELLNEAEREFSQMIGQRFATPSFLIGGPGLRTGYLPSQKTLLFPALDGVYEFGVFSDDVVLHEAFHSLICQYREETCSIDRLKETDNVILHEALADLFTYFLRRDEYFGEIYYMQKPHIRKYSSSSVWGLVEGSHAWAEILVSRLLLHGFTREDLKIFLRSDELSLVSLKNWSPVLKQEILQQEQQTLTLKMNGQLVTGPWRYRFDSANALVLELLPSEFLKHSHPNLRFELISATGSPLENYTVEKMEGGFKMTPNSPITSETIFLNIYSGEQTIGVKKIYLGRALKKSL